MYTRSRTHILRRLAAAALILLGAARGTASAQYQIDAWTTEHGLPQGTVYSIAQTPDGFLWISTFGGLARFDGLSFRVYDTVTNPELPNSRLFGVHVDDDGQLWVLTQDRILMRFRDGRFVVIGSSEGLPAGGVRRMTVERGRLVLHTDSGRYILKDGRLVPDERRDPPGAAGMTYLRESDSGARWYRDAAGAGHRFEGDRLTRTLALAGTNVFEDRSGRLWMHDKGELICVTGDTVRRYGRKDGVVPIDVLWVKEDPDGTVWFAESAGLVRFRDGRFTSFTKSDGLPATGVRSMFRDREGTHWVATESGLARLTERPIVSYTSDHGLAADNTYPILQDRRGDIWIGGWPGLTRYRDGVFQDMTKALGLGTPNVLSLLEDREGALWVGQWGGGVWRINISGDGRSQRFPGGYAPGLPPDVTFVIYQGRSPDIWFGGDVGAFRYHDGVFDPPLLRGVGGVNTFYEDARGALWIGHERGLARYDQGVLTQFGEDQGFSGRRVRVIHPDPSGALWIGTYDTGLFRYRDGVFTRFTTREGLPANGAFQILEDAQARFWICSNTGIYRVARSDLDDLASGGRRTVTTVRYGRDDGMANQECNGLGRPAGIRARDGRFWFPTQGGVAVVDPGALARQPPPPVSILDVMVGGVPVTSRDQIEIRSGSTSIEAHYAALTFVRPELAQFKYRMEGLDPDWVDAGSDRVARYTRLPYGNFRFRVIAANRDGVWNEEGASIAIVVVPPFWRTSWFMALMLVAVAAAAFGVHRWRLGVLERRQAVQQAFAQQLIDSQETDRKRIASELHDGVSQTLVVIKNWALFGAPTLPEDSAGRRRMGEIADAATQALGEVRHVVHDLLPYHLERLGLVEAIREAAARVADASGIQITCTLADVNGHLSTETSLRLFRVVQEGLNNVVKHSGATSAALEMTRDGAHVRLTIRDNGTGFDPGAVAPTEAGHGFGLVGMSERTRMMGGNLTIDSAPGHGTTLTIVVPARSE